ncbi:MAG: hypothetical protein QXN63_01880 [Candidatus Bathyarchaeia archaeon]
MVLKEECGLCGRVFPYYSLQRCSICGKLYCKDCVEFSWDKNLFRNVPFCLNCAKRLVSPRVKRAKYSPLGTYLTYRGHFTNVVKLSFAQIDGIIGDNLPLSALRSEDWWANSKTHAQSRVWLNAGWQVENVDLKEGTVTFRKVKEAIAEKKRRKEKTVKKPFTPAPVKPRRFRKPSKGKIAKLQARLKNIERRKASLKEYRGKFKPKTAYEKRLYREEVKSL